jgi:hypothetical protein
MFLRETVKTCPQSSRELIDKVSAYLSAAITAHQHRGESFMHSNRQWTVLAYLAGDNSLSVEMVRNLREMKLAQIGPDQPVTVVAQFDRAGSVVPVDRLVLTTGDGDGLLDSDAQILSAEHENSADSRTLTEFLRWGISSYPAQHYLVVLSGHGSGATENLFLKDDDAHASLTLAELRNVFLTIREEVGRELDIIALDSCLMSMAEVGYQLRGTARLMIGSEGLAPSSGWPHHRILSALTQHPEMPPAAVAEMVVDKYSCWYADSASAGLSTDIAACDLHQMDEIVAAVKNLAGILTSATTAEGGQQIRDAVIVSHWEAQTYKQDQYTDLYDFCERLAQRIKEEDILSACQRVMDIVKKAVLKSAFSGNDFQHSHGLSIYFPWSAIASEYSQLDFAVTTGWLEFLEAVVTGTRRAPRTVENPNAKLRPAPLAMAAGGHRYTLPYSKYTLPYSKYTLPYSKLAMEQMQSLKNPPLAYYHSFSRK